MVNRIWPILHRHGCSRRLRSRFDAQFDWRIPAQPAITFQHYTVEYSPRSAKKQPRRVGVFGARDATSFAPAQLTKSGCLRMVTGCCISHASPQGIAGQQRIKGPETSCGDESSTSELALRQVGVRSSLLLHRLHHREPLEQARAEQW